MATLFTGMLDQQLEFLRESFSAIEEIADAATIERLHSTATTLLELRRMFMEFNTNFEFSTENLAYEELLQLAERLGQVNCGATPERIAALPKHTFQPIAEETSSDRCACAICITDYEEGETITELPCRHRFHSECVETWLLAKAVCPLCKQDLE